MKYTKRLTLNRRNPTNNSFAYQIDGTIVTNSTSAMEVPSGTTLQRPNGINGEIRYNTTNQDTELYNISGLGTGWEKIKTNRQTVITPQNLGFGNYSNTLFGPLAYNVSTAAPQNVLVFVDNVYQIPTTNYVLVSGSGASTSTTLQQSVFPSANSLVVTTTTNILLGMTVTAASGVANGTTVTSVTTATNTIGLSLATTGAISSGTLITFAETAGTFVNFTSAVPAKAVFVLLGFDGYTGSN